MKLPEEGVLLRVFIGDNDRYNNRPLHEEIVKKARELNLAGATVVKGILGFGASSRIHSAKLLTLSEDLPFIVEIVDTEEMIEKILPFIDETVTDGLVTLEKMRIIKYRHKKNES